MKADKWESETKNSDKGKNNKTVKDNQNLEVNEFTLISLKTIKGANKIYGAKILEKDRKSFLWSSQKILEKL